MQSKRKGRVIKGKIVSNITERLKYISMATCTGKLRIQARLGSGKAWTRIQGNGRQYEDKK